MFNLIIWSLVYRLPAAHKEFFKSIVHLLLQVGDGLGIIGDYDIVFHEAQASRHR